MIIAESVSGDGRRSESEENNSDKSSSHKENNESMGGSKLKMHYHI